MGAVERLAETAVVNEGHDRSVRRGLERDAVAGLALLGGALLRGLDGAFGEPLQARRIGLVDEELERRGRVDHVLRELQRELGERDVDVAEALLARGVELGAVAAEICEGLREVAAARRLEVFEPW